MQGGGKHLRESLPLKAMTGAVFGFLPEGHMNIFVLSVIQ